MTDPGPGNGLSAVEAARRLAANGPNVLFAKPSRSLLAIALETLRDPMFGLLLAASALYLAFGNVHEGLALLGFVLITLGLTLYQEARTEHAIEALRDLTSPRARVIRDGLAVRIAGRDVVHGDLLLLAEGDRIAADAELVSASELQVDESLLTGEALPVQKLAAGEAVRAARPGRDSSTRVYAGTLVVEGQGTAQVVATGARSEIGRIGTALGTLDAEPSPLKTQMAGLVRTLALFAFGISGLLVIVDGWLRGDWLQALLAGIALAMSMLPQEFGVVLTVLPALGAWRLSRERVLVRRIAAIETLGAMSVLCVDKTGTLTENRMSVVQLHAAGVGLAVDEAVNKPLPEAFHALIEYSILASKVDPFDPMEQAFHRFGQHFLADTGHLHDDWTLAQTYGLTPQLRAMAHVWKADMGGAHVVAAKGAPEAIVELCHLDATAQADIAQAVNAMASQGLRVLGVARARFHDAPWPATQHDFEFEFVGLLGLADPLRREIPQVVRECQAAGIRVVMITGDYPATAAAIARQAGLDASEILAGEALETMGDAELQARMKTANVCARIAPAQKLRIVKALIANGGVVAMTGDGVNDAPALKAAHVGIAMGGRGTDVAREAAALVLLDDSFASIVRAVRLGRRIFDNLRKSMSYILAVHIPIAGMALVPVLLGWPVLLYPLHIALLELIIGPACSLIFENEPAEPGAMRRPPRDPRVALFGGRALLRSLTQGMVALGLAIGGYALALDRLDESAARAFAYCTLVVGNLSLIHANRAHRALGAGGQAAWNSVLWIVTGVALAVLTMVLYLPSLSDLFRFAPMPFGVLALACGLGVVSGLWLPIARRVRKAVR